MARTVAVVDGKARYEGRTRADWVPEVVGRIVAALDPQRIVLFGSVASGDDGPDSDIDCSSSWMPSTIGVTRRPSPPCGPCVDYRWRSTSCQQHRPRSLNQVIYRARSGSLCAREGLSMSAEPEELRDRVRLWLRPWHRPDIFRLAAGESAPRVQQGTL